MSIHTMNPSRLAILSLALALLAAATPAARAEDSSSPAGTLVVLGHLQERDFTRYLTLKGTLESKNQTTVSTRVGGTLKEVCVEVGDRVQAGQKLFSLDDRTYRDQVEVSEATLAARHSAVSVAQAQLEKAQASFHKASLDVERFRRLFEKKTVSSNELETYTLNYEAASADLSLAKANLSAAEAQVRLAEASLSIAKKNLEDCTILAPISGCVAARLQEPGEELRAEAAVCKILDPVALRVVAFLPAAYYAKIVPGKTELLVEAEDGAQKTILVTDKSPLIQSSLRTFQVRGELMVGEGECLVPGQLVGVSVALEKSHGFGVPLAVPVRRTSGLLLYRVEGGRAVSLPVEEGITQDGVVEVRGAGLSADLPIVVEGQYMIQDGDAVQAQ